jgi:hypothetical protein
MLVEAFPWRASAEAVVRPLKRAFLSNYLPSTLAGLAGSKCQGWGGS